MSQTRSVSFHSFATARLHNDRFRGAVESGVHFGFFPRVNVGESNKVDLIRGKDSSSILVTAEGQVIEESADVLAVVTIQPPNATFERRDLIVCQYQFTTDNTVEATYAVVKGKSATSSTEVPRPPLPQTIYQTPIAVVRVRPGSTTKATLLQTDLLPLPRAKETTVEETASLKPQLDPTDSSRIFVQAGSFLNAAQVQFLRFDGGYSASLTDDDLSLGDTRYYLFAMGDDLEVQVADSADTDSIPAVGSDLLPLAWVRATKTGGGIVINDLRDVRVFNTRKINATPEVEAYKQQLAGSVFSSMRVDTFEDDSLIDLTTLQPVADDLTAAINAVDNSLEIDYSAGVSELEQAVTIVTEDLLNGMGITALRHFQVDADHNIPGLTFDWSVSSKTSGFTGNDHDFGVIYRVTPSAGTRFYLKFNIPLAAITPGTIRKIRSYGALLNLSGSNQNAGSLLSSGFDAVRTSINNLIANGDFRLWSRRDQAGNVPDVNAQDTIDYPFLTDTADAARDQVFAADGWQWTKREFEATDGVVSRVILSKDVVPVAAISDVARDTALQFRGIGGATISQVNELEYRVPVEGSMLGERITFALNMIVSPSPIYASIGIQFYTRTSSGTLALQGARKTAAPRSASATVAVTSDDTITAATAFVGFIVTMKGGISQAVLSRACAVIGAVQEVLFTRPQNAEELVRKIYERGSAFVAGAAGASGQAVGVAVQLGAVKSTVLGELVAQVQPFATASQSESVSSLAVTSDGHSLRVEGTASSAGPIRIDLDWEVGVRYDRVE